MSQAPRPPDGPPSLTGTSEAASASLARQQFLTRFLRHPLQVGSIVPSSRYLANAVVKRVPSTARAVAEFGSGTGPITRVLLDRLGPQATVLAIEIDPDFCAMLRRELPDPRLRVIEGPAQDLPQRAREAGFPDGVDAIVSGLPFANFPRSLRYELVRVAHSALKPGGTFAAYGYMPLALPPVMRDVFGECRFGYVVRNIPPAFIFSATKKSGP